MTRLLGLLPTFCVVGFVASGRAMSFDPTRMRPASLLPALVAGACIWALQRRGKASPIHKGLTGFVIFGAISFWVWPSGLGRLVSAQPMFCLYGALLLVAVGPPLLGRAPFTTYFARQTAPEAVWKTDVFLNINRNMTRVWAALFGLSAGITLLPTLLSAVIEARWMKHIFWDALPLGLMLLGARFNKWYPEHYQRQMGIEPFAANGIPAHDAAATPGGPPPAGTCRELIERMPLGFRPERAEGVEAVYQFEVTDEGFVAHLRIADQRCAFSEGPADRPDVVIKTPGTVWLAIAGGELDGQQAFMEGRYQVEGNVALLMKLRGLFGDED